MIDIVTRCQVHPLPTKGRSTRGGDHLIDTHRADGTADRQSAHAPAKLTLGLRMVVARLDGDHLIDTNRRAHEL